MNHYLDAATKAEADRLEELQAKIANLMVLKAEFNAEQARIRKRINQRYVRKLGTIERRRRRAAERAEMYQPRFEGTV